MMDDVVNNAYSTTKNMTTQKPIIEANPEDKFETVLLLPDGEGEVRQGEGGLRTKGHFKQAQDNAPLITVITVVYNGEQFLEETILSVINQTYDNVEYIIIDGGSTDGTIDIIRKYEHVIDYWVSEKDKGIYDAMNKGVDLARGTWVNFMNSGDLFENSDVLSCIFRNNKYIDLSVIYGATTVFNNGMSQTVQPKNVNLLLKGRMPFIHQSAFIYLDLMKKHLYSLEYKINSDFNFFLHSYLLSYKFCKINLVVSRYRLGGYSHQNKKLSYQEKLAILKSNNILNRKFKIYYFYTLLRTTLKKVICSTFKILGLKKFRIFYFLSVRCIN